MGVIKGINCHFSLAYSPIDMITKERVYGDCLEDIGIVIPNGGFVVVDRTVFPKVGDLVICSQYAGAVMGEMLKLVLEIGEDIVVGTRYKDKSRDFTFKAGEIRGVARYVMDDKGTILWECKRLKGKVSKYFMKHFLKTSKNEIVLRGWECNNDGLNNSTEVKLKHEPLKKCPHCGGIAKIEYKQEFGTLRSGFFVECKKCGCSSAPKYEGETLALQRKKPKYGYVSFPDALNYVVDKWNTRYEVTANA